MTKWISFDTLTWPEVAELPRHYPLVIPLGNGYNRDKLAEALNQPHQIALLPSFPFGWRGSQLAVPEHLLRAYLWNLLNSLRDDGFVHVYVLSPAGIQLDLGESQIVQPYSPKSDHLFPDESNEKVLLIPIGHTEQHGYHLPLSTDTLIIQAITAGVVQTIPDQACSLPVMPYGVSTHRSEFAGTLNAGGRAFEDFWLAVVDSLVLRGFKRFYFLSGHGGNCSFLTTVIKYAGERYPNIFCATAYLYLSSPQGIQILEQYRQSGVGGMGHACELETSLMLYLHPELVQIEKAVDEIDFIATPSFYMDWVEGGALIANPPWSDDTRSGSYGAGSLATREKGEVWFNAAVQEKVGHVAEIQEQFRRRAKKKKITSL